MPICQQCGAEMRAGAKFCPECGKAADAHLEHSASETNEEAVPSQVGFRLLANHKFLLGGALGLLILLSVPIYLRVSNARNRPVGFLPPSRITGADSGNAETGQSSADEGGPVQVVKRFADAVQNDQVLTADAYLSNAGKSWRAWRGDGLRAWLHSFELQRGTDFRISMIEQKNEKALVALAQPDVDDALVVVGWKGSRLYLTNYGGKWLIDGTDGNGQETHRFRFPVPVEGARIGGTLFPAKKKVEIDRPASIASPSPSPTNTATTVPKGTPVSESSEEARFIQRWVNAQINCNFTEYESLYAADFRGVKRNASNDAKEFDRVAWMKSAQSVFKNQRGGLRVEVRDLRDLGDGERGKTIEFEQHYWSRTNAYHGPKRLVLRRAVSGYVIVYEQLLAAHATKLEARTTNGGYVCPESNQRLLTVDDLRNRTPDELRLMRNEIFARHGKVFKDQSLAQHFATQPWYHSNPALSSMKGLLSAIEEKNIAFILAYEKTGGRPMGGTSVERSTPSRSLQHPESPSANSLATNGSHQKGRYLLIAGSFSRNEPGAQSKANDRATALKARGFSDAKSGLSDNYSGLKPGYWITIVARYENEPEARAGLDQVKQARFAGYVRQLNAEAQ